MAGPFLISLIRNALCSDQLVEIVEQCSLIHRGSLASHRPMPIPGSFLEFPYWLRYTCLIDASQRRGGPGATVI
jgi:hypothetical protein